MAQPDWSDDPVVRGFRDEISETDQAILEAVNHRLELVGKLRDYKVERGYPFLDPGRESLLLDDLARRNPGPLSEGAVRELFAGLLALVKRELAGAGAGSRSSGS